MTVEYEVINNPLTAPPSYTARVAAKNVLGYDEIAAAINLHNPTIPIATAKHVLEALREEIIIQLLDGNTVNLNNFASWVITMPIRLDVATDPLPVDPADIRCKPSKPFKDEIKTAISFSRVGYAVKEPQIFTAIDTNTNILNWVRTGYGMRLSGKFIGFDPTDTDQGVFITGPDGSTVTPQNNISLNDPSNVIFQASIPTPSRQDYVENTVAVTTKYTENGQLKTGTYAKKIRATNMINTTGVDTRCFTVGEAASNPADIKTYSGSDGDTIIVALTIKPTGELFGKVALLGGEFGSEVAITAVGFYTLSCSGGDVGFDVGNYTTLYDNVTAYGKYMTEVANITTV